MKDHEIRTLLDLHDQIIDQENGYWLKIEAWEVKISKDIPHGIRYSLTLHAPSGKRILGYDNALIINIGILQTRVCHMHSKMRINCYQTFLLKLIRF